uniref:tRNA pseudouridine synthase A n=1 Tax=Candidatus Kentrum sp. MB TaxID=2138164 RepID=A0A450XVC9_9GAMM|nr:MAG: tRNA pseudouridine38-40 synthase [Candidatus Kentron sp. MB]VFK76109.1 MAG: tRNA pseudouridine38-40 synthase [Candidatus Kentron sp. MB]
MDHNHGKLPRIALGIEYDGSDFAGWETQKQGRTVQSCVEQALSKVADSPIRVVCAGRTDAGVHAQGQVVHFETDVLRENRAWVYGTNANLPRDVSILWARDAPGEFHARFSARSRSYRYRILNRPVRPALLRNRFAWECRTLSTDRMQAGADYLLGEHDFSAFRSSGCQAASPVRTIHHLQVTRHGEHIHVDVVANAFLHHMVRNIVGVLLAIGLGKREPAWAARVLANRDRTQAGITAPAQGLCLMEVRYPEHFRIPSIP